MNTNTTQSVSLREHINAHTHRHYFHFAMQATGKGNVASCGRMGGGGGGHSALCMCVLGIYSTCRHIHVHLSLLRLLSQGLWVHINLYGWHNWFLAVSEAAPGHSCWHCSLQMLHNPSDGVRGFRPHALLSLGCTFATITTVTGRDGLKNLWFNQGATSGAEKWGQCTNARNHNSLSGHLRSSPKVFVSQ